MSDDRMDRAERIRRMNEGRGAADAGDGSSADESEAGADGDDAANGPPEEAANGPPEEAANGPPEEAANGPPEEAANGPPEAHAEPVDAEGEAADRAGGEDGDAATAREPDGRGSAEREESSDGPADDEATATALRAAQASASVDAALDPPDGSPGTSTAAASTGADAETPAGDAPGDASAAGDAAAVGGPAGAEAGAEATVRVLEFAVGDQAFCLDIAVVEEIVEHESVTRVPNAPECVSGVVDLRGQITTILDPPTFLDVGGGADPSLIVVFDPGAFESQGAVGWLVDDVRRVASVPESAVTDAPGDEEHVRGVLDRAEEDELVVWVDPHAALDLVTDGDAGADG